MCLLVLFGILGSSPDYLWIIYGLYMDIWIIWIYIWIYGILWIIIYGLYMDYLDNWFYINFSFIKVNYNKNISLKKLS